MVSESVGGLPTSERVAVGALSRLFDNHTTSYKFFFFLALLSFVRRSRLDGNLSSGIGSPLSLKDLAIEMALLAWYPRKFCRLSFGGSDQLAQEVDALPWSRVRGSWIQAEGSEWNRLRAEISGSIPTERLMRYVPFRLIRPFFERETVGLKNDTAINLRIAELSISAFDVAKPIYRFSEDRTAIYFHHDWVAYLDANLPIIDGWAKFKLARYLQVNNPGAVGLLEKLVPPLERSSLSVQTRYWKFFLSETSSQTRSIYTGRNIEVSKFTLDHFLPWSYVAHDRVWNLVPEESRVNSSKSDSLPSVDYLEPFIRLQHEALTSTRDRYHDWEKIWEPYESDLGLSKATLEHRGRFIMEMEEYLKRHLSAARQQGFHSEWRYVG